MIEPATTSDSSDHLDEVLDQFELSWSPDAQYLKAAVEKGGLQLNQRGIAELIRADIDRRYASDCEVNLHRYFEWFPDLIQDASLVQEIGFEDFRSRKTRGLLVHLDRWSWMPKIKLSVWFQELMQVSSLEKKSAAYPSQPIRNAVQSPRVDVEPRIGEKFGDFQLLATLGAGSFSRVYLATQPSLASRYVALKVVKKTLDEPEHLARLQHTGIVSIYSLHRIGSYSVLCMPYYGAATLSDWLGDNDHSAQRNGQSLIGTVQQAQTRIGSSHSAESDSPTEPSSNEVDRIRVWNAAGAQPLSRLTHLDAKGCLLWLSRRIASALAHAHEREVVHGDLKPANVLLKNDGEPALIDFNLAHSLDEQSSTHVGGTLPYMSPEQLQMLLGRRLHLSAASDIYSLGIMLYQVAEGRMPFPVPLSSADSDVSVANQHRRETIHFDSPTLSAGLKSILSKCLAYEPSHRYSSGTTLLEDLDCEASNLPLIHAKESFFRSRIPKLVHRYPRLFSVIPVLAIAALFVASLAFASWYWWRESSQWNSRDSLSRWTGLLSVQVPGLLEGSDDEIQSSVTTLDKAIHTMMGSEVESGKIAKLEWLPASELKLAEREFFDDLLMVTGLANERRSQLLPEHLVQIDRWLRLCQFSSRLTRSKTVESLRSTDNRPLTIPLELSSAAIDTSKLATSTDCEKILQARSLALRGLPVRSIETLSELTPRRANECLYWITVGDAQKKLGHPEAAMLAYGLAINKAPRSEIGYSRRCQLYAEMKKWADAEKDCTMLIDLNPQNAFRYAERARLREPMGKIEDAIADMDQALDLDPKANRYYFFRSRLGRNAKDLQKAKDDFRQGISLIPETTEDWISRALAQLPRHPEKAMADLKRAEQIESNRFEVLQNQAHVLSEYLHDETAAIQVLSAILENQPENEWARVDRCVLLARAGRKDQVLADIESVLSSGKAVLPATCYQIACAHSLLANEHLECREQAHHFLSKAILGGYGHDLLETDKDLDSIRTDSKFSSLLEVTQLAKKTAIN